MTYTQMIQWVQNEQNYQTFSGVFNGSIATSAVSTAVMSNTQAYNAYQELFLIRIT